MPRYKIMVVDDEKSMREFLEIMLKKEGYDVASFDSGEAAVERFKKAPCDLVITDLRMPGMGGVNLLKAMKGLDNGVMVIMITAYASVDSAVEAMKSGAYDYFTKPFNVEEIKLNIKRALEVRRLERENILLKKDIKSRYGLSNIVGASRKMAEVYGFIMSIAAAKANVLITGESGTGKELVARAIHNESPRKEKPFVTVNCGAIPESLVESELFGHARGAFTGAVYEKAGLAEMADGGTLFLDEITELPLNLQVKLFRFIQEKSFRRVGSTNDISVDMRLIAATNKDVEKEVEGKRFREDLFYRLNVIRIHIPPLKEIKKISGEALNCLMDYDYSGNVRELENAIERAVALEAKDCISVESLPPSIRNRCVKEGSPATPGDKGTVTGPGASTVTIPPEGIDLEEAVSEFEKNIIKEALKKAGGVKGKAAKLLGISFRSIRYKLGKYDE